MFDIIDHTADTGIRAAGATLEELFESAGQGLIYIIFGGQDVGKIGKECDSFEIKVSGNDPEELLFSFLSEILYLLDGKGIILTAFSGSKLDDGTFSTSACGITLKSEKILPKIEVKAVTYHHMDIVKTDNLWQTDVIFDI